MFYLYKIFHGYDGSVAYKNLNTDFVRPPLRSAFHDKTALIEVPNILRSTARKKKKLFRVLHQYARCGANDALSHSCCRHVGIIDGKKLKSAKMGWRLMASGSLKVSWKSVQRYTV